MHSKKSFTLVELMIVIAILAILSAIVIFTLNPSRLFDNFRDTRRVSDIQSINKAIVFMESWNTSAINYGTNTTLYISLPDSSTTCNSYTLPTLPAGYIYNCKPTSTYKNSDGTGWIPIDFTVSNSNRYLSTLPIDPVNNTTFFYTYFPGGSYEVSALLKNPNTNSINDDDSLTGAFTLGSPNRSWTSPLSRDTNLVGHWKFDEGTGTTAYDSSGYGNHSLAMDANTFDRTTLAYGEKVIRKFARTNYGITIPYNSAFNNTNDITVIAWTNFTDTGYMHWAYRGPLWNAGWLLYQNNSTERLWGVSANSQAYVVGLSSATTSTWYFVAGTYNSTNREMHFYRNNAKTATAFPVNVNLISNHGIGILGSIYTAMLDDFRVYNRALSSSEISQIYNQTKSKYQ